MLVLTATTEGLASGQYTAVVTVAAPSVQARMIQIAFTVTPGPAIGLSRTTVAFSAFTGGADPLPETMIITNAGGGSLTGLTAGAPQYASGTPGWLTAELAGTEAPATLTLTAAAGALSDGTYTATVSVSSSVAGNSPIQITVTLIKGPAPVMVLTPTSLTFATFSGGSAPAVQNVGVTNSGGGVIGGLSTTIAYGPGASGWLDAGFLADDTTAPATLQIRPNTSLTAGTYTASVEVRTMTQGVASRTVNVSYTLYSFAANVVPFFQSSVPGAPSTPCTGCHFGGGQSPNLSGSPSAIWNELVPPMRVLRFQPNAGVLICRIKNSCPGSTNMSLPSGPVSLIQLWIASGAPQ
jgi:hypothetical protein